MSSLKQVREKGQKVAEAIASVLKMEVEIIDTELVRVAGTGIVRNDVGMKMRRGLVNRHVLATKKPVFIKEPGFHDICLSCPLTGNCFYRASIVYPISVREEIVGTISLIAFDDRQKATLCNNSESLLEFVGRMADLIGSKVVEEKVMTELAAMANRLETVINAVHEGMVAIDRQERITQINHSAENLLGLKISECQGRLIGETLPGLPLPDVVESGKGYADREVFIKLPDRRLHFVSTAQPIQHDNHIIGAVATIRDFVETQRFAYKIVNKQQNITFDDILGESKALMDVKARAKKIARSDSTVLIIGESGTGKELFARAIHFESAHRRKPFVAINCGAIPEALLESELFGYDEGAFTGARRGGKPGKFEVANGGTVMLDEIGTMSLYLQAKLLRVLQEKQVERVGGNKVIPLDFRLIAATNSNLQEMVQKKEFREDLYYRLNVIPLFIPSLREREGDIVLLLNHYLQRYRQVVGKDIQGFSEEALKICQNYSWPGNVRELVNAVEYAVNLEEERFIGVDSLPPKIRDFSRGLRSQSSIRTLEELEIEAIRQALDNYGWSEEGKRQAAIALGISRATIYRKIQKYSLGQQP